MKILLIEDKKQKEIITKKYLTDAKFDVEIVVARSVADACDTVLSMDDIDGIVIDMQLPDVSGGSINIAGGVDIIRILKENSIVCPRVVNTSSEETKEVLLKANMVDEEVIINSSRYNCSRQFITFINNVQSYVDNK